MAYFIVPESREFIESRGNFNKFEFAVGNDSFYYFCSD